MNIDYALNFKKRASYPVWVKDVCIGGGHPVVIQSMLCVAAHQVDQAMHEIRSLHAAGCQLIRITIPNRRDLQSTEKIKHKMQAEGIDVPLVADIHFSPHLALEACELFDKIRINPGNYSDRSKNAYGRKNREREFEAGKQTFFEGLQTLVKHLNRHNCALRIGVNQGSLSTRMIEAYGDSPLGMAQSALEAVGLLHQLNFKRVVVSLKSSNPLIVQKAYRLTAQLLPADQQIPFHLGVTEAGNGEIARMKALVGIGALLADGIGDTIRVSLTEPSVHEVRFAKQLLKNVHQVQQKSLKNNPASSLKLSVPLMQMRPHRKLWQCQGQKIGEAGAVKLLAVENSAVKAPENLEVDVVLKSTEQAGLVFIQQPEQAEQLDANKHQAVVLDCQDLYAWRKLRNHALPLGLLLKPADLEQTLPQAMILSEGLADFLWVAPDFGVNHWQRLGLLLQVLRIKLQTTDYIACPSCGRTLFDLEQVTAKIQAKTQHLKGLKIGVMGCIVNGPGEMADADFGYVGSGVGKVDLYAGQQRIACGIHENKAVEALIELIKNHDRWFEPK